MTASSSFYDRTRTATLTADNDRARIAARTSEQGNFACWVNGDVVSFDGTEDCKGKRLYKAWQYLAKTLEGIALWLTSETISPVAMAGCDAGDTATSSCAEEIKRVGRCDRGSGARDDLTDVLAISSADDRKGAEQLGTGRLHRGRRMGQYHTRPPAAGLLLRGEYR